MSPGSPDLLATAPPAPEPVTVAAVAQPPGSRTVHITDRVAEQSALHAIVVALLTLALPAVGTMHLATLKGTILTVAAALLGAAIQVARNGLTIHRASKAEGKMQAYLRRAQTEDAVLSAKLKSLIGAPAYNFLDATLRAEEPALRKLIEAVLVEHGLITISGDIVTDVQAVTKEAPDVAANTIVNQVADGVAVR